MFGIALNEMRADFNTRREVSHHPFLLTSLSFWGRKTDSKGHKVSLFRKNSNPKPNLKKKHIQMYLCMSFVSYDNNNYIITYNIQLTSTHYSDQLEGSLAALVTVHN